RNGRVPGEAQRTTSGKGALLVVVLHRILDERDVQVADGVVVGGERTCAFAARTGDGRGILDAANEITPSRGGRHVVFPVAGRAPSPSISCVGSAIAFFHYRDRA